MKTPTPLGDRVIVRLLDREEKTKGGIIIPDTAQERSQTGEVIAVGKGRRTKSGERIEPEVKKGDRVLVGRGYTASYTEVELEGEKLIFLKEEDILAIL